jgi:hypothetical protein
MKETSGDGVTGFLLYNPFNKNYFFRVYNEADRSQFIDYKICAEDIEVTLVGNFVSLYEGEDGEKNRLDYSSKVLGKK